MRITDGILVLGGTGPTGTLVMQGLRGIGTPVTAILRSSARQAELETLGIKVILGDAMDRNSVFQAVSAAAADCSLVLNLLGGNPFADPATWPDLEGVNNVTDAAVAAGIKRYVLVTSVGTGASWQYVPETAGYIKPIIELKTQAEAYLKNTDLDWTIIKPGGLWPPGYEFQRGKALITENHGVRGLIDREDLAEVLLEVLSAAPETILHKELYAVVERIEHHAGEPREFKL